MKTQISMAVLMMGVGLAVFAASPESRLQYYHEQLASKDSGVYEHDDDLYVQVRQAAKKSENRKRVEMKAILFAKDLLRRWMVDHVAAERAEGAQQLPQGLKRAVAVLDSINPMWRFGDVKYDLNGQEFNLGIKDGHFTFGQVFSREAVEKAIPAAFSQAPTEELVRKHLKVLIPLALKGNQRRLYGDCRTWDLAGSADNLPFVQEIRDYLVNNELAGRLREGMGRYCVPETVSWSISPVKVDEHRNENVDNVTNAMEKIVYVTNRLERAQRAEEIKAMGMAMGGKVQETRVLSDEEEVVEVKTVTTVVTRRLRRIRNRVQVCGEPRFEKIFLAAGDGLSVGDRQSQTPLGAEAVQSFLGEGAYDKKFAKVEDALRENPYDADLWNLLGRLLYVKDDCLGALNCYRIAIRLDPRHGFALTNLALVYEKLGAQDEALGYAVLVMGSVDNAWCTKMAERILLSESKEIPK